MYPNFFFFRLAPFNTDAEDDSKILDLNHKMVKVGPFCTGLHVQVCDENAIETQRFEQESFSIRHVPHKQT